MRTQFFSHDSVNKKIFRAALTIGSATVVVKVAATLKDLMVARSFGRNDSLDAFLIALVLPTFAMGLVATSLALALIPVLVETRQKEGVPAAQQLLSSIFLVTGFLLVAAGVLLGLCAPLYLPYLAHSFPQQKLVLTREFLYLLVPWLVLGGLATFMGFVLNAIEKFAVPALVPILTPTAVLVCVSLWTHHDSGFALVAGTVTGSFLEASFLFYLIRKHNILGALQWHGIDERVKSVLWQTGPMMAGSLLMGATPVVDQVMAAVLGAGSVSALNYGNKVPIGLVSICAMALSTAVLPYFSQMVADGDWQGCKHTLKRYTALNATVSIPLTILLAIFSRPIIHLLFQRGAFTSADTEIVSRVQAGYMLQVPFYVLSMIFVRFITAMRRNDLLMYGAAINLVVDIAMNLVLMRIWGVAGIALSTSIVIFISFLFLSICSVKLLNQKLRRPLPSSVPGPVTS